MASGRPAAPVPGRAATRPGRRTRRRGEPKRPPSPPPPTTPPPPSPAPPRGGPPPGSPGQRDQAPAHLPVRGEPDPPGAGGGRARRAGDASPRGERRRHRADPEKLLQEEAPGAAGSGGRGPAGLRAE